MITVGVEEEYLLLDPRSGLPVAQGERVRAAADLQPVLDGDEVEPELLQAQVEVATPICESLADVGGHLTRLRGAVGAAADRVGCRLSASGTAPFSGPIPVPVTDKPRYRAMLRDAPQLVDEQLISGMHVHVAIPDRESGTAALARLRPWLPVLVAMGANSPLWDGRDTGFASWRTIVFGRWPVSGPPPVFADAADYDRRAELLVDSGVIRDRGQLYWQARLSERFPTLEVRALDVQLRVEDAVLLAGVVRGLVATALREVRDGAPPPGGPPELVAAANWQAARHGLGGALLDPRDGQRRPAGDVVVALVDHIGGALEATGDLPLVEASVRRLLRGGTGAVRQRRALREGGVDALLGLLAAHGCHSAESPDGEAVAGTAAPRASRSGEREICAPPGG